MDNGSTGCALQRVSKHFREASRYSRFTSVCLYRSKDILRFEAAITPLPPNERRVRYLHITSPHLFLDVSEDELEDDGDYESSGSESSSESNDDTFATAENPGDEAGVGSVEMDIYESDSDDDEYRPLSPTEESEVDDDIAYLMSSATSFEATTSQLYEGKDPMGEYMAEMDEANRVIVSSVKQIISALSSTLYALSIHWTREFESENLSIPDFIPSTTSLPCLTELYLCINLRSYTLDKLHTRQDTYPASMFYDSNGFLEKFNGLTFPALRRLRFAGLAWPGVECPYDMVKRMAPNLTHIRTKTDLMLGVLGPFIFPANLKVFIEVPHRILGRKVLEVLINDRNIVRDMGYDPQHVTVVGIGIPEAYDADCWEDHWEADVKGEHGHWLLK